MAKEYNIVKVCDAVMHNEEISAEDYKMFIGYFCKAFTDDNTRDYFIQDIVNTLLLQLKLHCSLDTRDKNSDRQKFVYIRKVARNSFGILLSLKKHQYGFGEILSMDKDLENPKNYLGQILNNIGYEKAAKDIDNFVYSLSAREQELYDMRICQGVEYGIISKELGISRERCRQCVHRLREKIQLYMFTKGFIY